MIERYDFPTIDYAVQGWDTLLNDLVAKLQEMIVTREVVILGETVAAYDALYQKSSDSKWWKAQADGSKQPCQGIALTGGDEDHEIRIHRIGKLMNAGSWGTVGAPIYLDPSTAGAMTQTKPSVPNAQIVGYALSATDMLVLIAPDVLPCVEPINVDTTGVGNVGAGEDTLMSYSLPANSLDANKKGIRVTVYGTVANNANAKTVKVYFGTTAVYSASMTVNQAYKWYAQFTAIRTEVDAQDVFGTGFIENIALLLGPYFATDTQDDGAAIVIKCTGEGVDNDDIIQQGMLIEYIN